MAACLFWIVFVPHSFYIDWKLHISVFPDVHFGMVLAVVSKRTYQKSICLISLLSILLKHFANFDLKFYYFIKHNVYFSTTRCKNLIFKEHCIVYYLFYGKNFALYFTCKMLCISWGFNFTVSSETFFVWFIFAVEDNFFIDWVFKTYILIHTQVSIF